MQHAVHVQQPMVSLHKVLKHPPFELAEALVISIRGRGIEMKSAVDHLPLSRVPSRRQLVGIRAAKISLQHAIDYLRENGRLRRAGVVRIRFLGRKMTQIHADVS